MKNGKNIMPSYIVLEEYHRYRPQPKRMGTTVQSTTQYMQEKRPMKSRFTSSFASIRAVFSL